MRYDIFVSYRWVEPDQTWVREHLVPALKAAGLTVLLDVEDFVPGRDVILEMTRAGEESARALCVLSDAYVDGDRMAHFESLMARRLDPTGRNSRLIPFVLRPVKLPEWMQGLVPVDWTDPRGRAREWRRLLTLLGVTRIDVPQPGAPAAAASSSAGTVFTLELDAQLRMTGDERGLLVALDELLLKVEDGAAVSVRVIEPEIAEARRELARLREIADPTIDDRAHIVALHRKLRGRINDEPPFDQLLGEVFTTLLTKVAARVRGLGNAEAVYDCLAETLRLYAVPRAHSGVSLDCLVKQHDWVLLVVVDTPVVEDIAEQHVGALEWLTWNNTPVHIADFTPEAIRQFFVPQLLVGYFQLKYRDVSAPPPDIEEVFDFARVRVGLH